MTMAMADKPLGRVDRDRRAVRGENATVQLTLFNFQSPYGALK